MNNENKKFITVSFVAAGIIIGIVVSSLLAAFSTFSGAIASAYANDSLRHGIPVALGIVTFLVLQFNKIAVTYADEVVSELKKVVWPNRKDTTAMTIVVCIMVLISGLVLGFFDFISNYVVNKLLTMI
jgi:preprotein translocase subunit SecE